ncbi:MAG: hydrogenase iron-sulfur subunit [Candidatus Helarchaeota archaeon]
MSEDSTKSSKILVIGGGVAGITAALDLGDQGFDTYLVESSPSIGGRMAQLDKTFPTLDCSICILAPKMVEAARHENINLLTYSEVREVTKLPNGNFKVKIEQKPRYVDTSKCTGCGVCTEKCPSKKIPHEFEANLINRTAVYIPFPQAVPRKATIDAEHCLFFQKGICRVCEKFCTAGAIDFEQKPTFIEEEFASIVVATGFDLINPADVSPRWGYGEYQNVVDSLQYERILSASGPFGGEISRPSDKKHPHKIAFILCVGSRNCQDENAVPYCSKFCCLYSTKSSIITREHAPDIDVTIFYNDLRTIGKGHEEFFVRAENEYGIRYIKGLPSAIEEDPKTNNLILRYADLKNLETNEEEFELAVLCPAVTPRANAMELSKILGIDADEFGFFKTPDSTNILDSSVEGIYVVGCCQSPEDISHSVAKALGASAKAATHGIPLPPKEKVYEHPERIVSPNEEPRIGVFVCHCGINIGGVVDVPAVVEYAKGLKNVVFAMPNLYTCSEDSQQIIKEKILEHDLNRVIVAACTPRTHEPLFQETIREAGLNPYLFTFSSIRELDSWVHMKEPEKATEKAKDLVRMSVGRARYLRPQQTFEADVVPAALIIGGGVAGLTSALNIAGRGFQVYLVEKEPDLGGLLNNLEEINFDRINAKKLITHLKEEVKSTTNIKVFTSSEVVNVYGSIGDFAIDVETPSGKESFKVGVVLVTVGGKVLKPDGLYAYGQHPNVYTNLEFVDVLKSDKIKDGDVIALINCVGSRDPDGITYCASTCCSTNLQYVLKIHEKYPNSRIFVLYRDIRVDPEGEIHYWKARKVARFIRYSGNEKPQVTVQDSKLLINVMDSSTAIEYDLEVDHVVLGTPIIPFEDNKKISELLKIPLDSSKFFLEAHPKLRPVDFATDGVFVAGVAQQPKRVNDSISQALGASCRALKYLVTGKVESEGITAEVDQSICIGCQVCQPLCPYGAIGIHVDEGKTVSEVNPLLCKGCGCCAVACPAGAITMRHYTDPDISAMVDEALAIQTTGSEPKMVGFLCNWCCYAGADNAGVSRFQYPPNIRIIRVMCSARIDPLFILQAFLDGADGVFVGGCHIGDCHYISGNEKTLKRINKLHKKLEEMGINPKRLRLEWVSASEGKIFQEVVTEFTKELEELGNLQLKPLEVKK